MNEVSKATFDLANARVVVYVSYPSPVYYESVEDAQEDVEEAADEVADWIRSVLGGGARPKPCIVLGAKDRVVISKEIPLSSRQIMNWTTLSPFGGQKAELKGILGQNGFHLDA